LLLGCGKARTSDSRGIYQEEPTGPLTKNEHSGCKNVHLFCSQAVPSIAGYLGFLSCAVVL
jgi:hypothetical protein